MKKQHLKSGTDDMFYSGEKLLNSLDLDKKKPEIIISQTLRSYGKTTFYNRYLMDRFMMREHTLIINRYKYEMKGSGQRFCATMEEWYPHIRFREINVLKDSVIKILIKTDPPEMIEKDDGSVVLAEEVWDDNDLFGYACCLSGFDGVKKTSNMMRRVTNMIFDEFQSEDDKYLPGEIDKLISIHTSVARRKGEPVRFVRLILLSNKVRMINPYYLSLGISERYEPRTKYMRGHGWVFENLSNPTISDLAKESRFNIAFSNEGYMGYILDEKFKNEGEYSTIHKMAKGKLMLTVGYKGETYDITRGDGYFYVTDTGQPNLTDLDLDLAEVYSKSRITPPSLVRVSQLTVVLRSEFSENRVFFKNVPCKQMFILLCSIDTCKIF